MPEPVGPEAPVQPLDVTGIGAALVGTGLWAVALIVCLVFRTALIARGDEWWVGVCIAGVALGLIGLAYAIWRQRQSVPPQG